MAKQSITKTIRISPDRERFLLDNFKFLTEGIAYCIDKVREGGSMAEENLRILNTLSLEEIKGQFEIEEIYLVIEALKGTQVNGAYRCNPRALVTHCYTTDKLYNLSEKYAVHLPLLSQKIERLTAAQTNALYDYIEGFWRGSDRDIERYATLLLNSDND